MKIFVFQLGGSKVLTIDVGSQATLWDLKTLIRDSEDIKWSICLQLVFKEGLLEESMNATTLEACGIETGATLTMIKQATPFVLTASDDKTATIGIGYSSTENGPSSHKVAPD